MSTAPFLEHAPLARPLASDQAKLSLPSLSPPEPHPTLFCTREKPVPTPVQRTKEQGPGLARRAVARSK